MSSVDGASRNPQRIRNVLRSISRTISTAARITKIRDDIKINDLESISDETVYSYINAFKNAFILENLQAWKPNLRSQIALRTSDTHHFVDPSIAVASLAIGPGDLIDDLRTMGLLFESLCIRDLRIYSEVLGGSIYQYRDNQGLECDAIIHPRDGRYALIEAELGGSDIDTAANNLIKLKNKIDTDQMREPSLMAVLTGTQYAYEREDGILVVPVSCLKD